MSNYAINHICELAYYGNASQLQNILTNPLFPRDFDLNQIGVGADGHRDSPLMHALTSHYNSRNKTATVKLLLAYGAKAYFVTGKLQYTPLHVAHTKETAQLLIDNGAHVNVWTKPPRDFTPLMKAAEYNRPEVIDVLLANGAELFLEKANGESLLDVASLATHGQIARHMKKLLQPILDPLLNRNVANIVLSYIIRSYPCAPA